MVPSMVFDILQQNGCYIIRKGFILERARGPRKRFQVTSSVQFLDFCCILEEIT